MTQFNPVLETRGTSVGAVSDSRVGTGEKTVPVPCKQLLQTTPEDWDKAVESLEASAGQGPTARGDTRTSAFAFLLRRP